MLVYLEVGIYSKDKHMRGFLINKNLCLYYWLKKRVGKEWAFRLAVSTEKVILIFGREPIQEEVFKGILEGRCVGSTPTSDTKSSQG
jgi:hypothetical protein